jgi:hypothetical protein
MGQYDFRTTLAQMLVFHCRQLRPILLQGAIDPDKWMQAHRFIVGAFATSWECLGDTLQSFENALAEEARSITYQADLIEKTLHRLEIAGGEKTRRGITIVRHYHDVTRQNVADVIIAYTLVLRAFGEAAFASEFAAAAARMRDAMRDQRRRRSPTDGQF